MRIKESIKDRIINFFLIIGSKLRKLFKITKQGNHEPDRDKMKLVFQDNFQKFNTSTWRVGQPWGLFHPGGPYQYYGKDSVYIENQHLVLDHRYKPTQMTAWDNPKVYDIPYSVGLITSYDDYGYGFYEFECKLPKGVGLWPAVWLSCVDSWPPEIDINESYSDGNGDYRSKLETNFHYNLGENKESAGAREHSIYAVDKRIKFSCWWTKDFIKIYYNGYLVRVITSENILKWYRDKRMLIILNNALREEFLDKQPKVENEVISKFEIYSVRYWES